MNTQFKDTWILWYHHEKDNWSASGFKQLYKIKSISDFWKFYNNWSIIGGVTNKHIFLMKEGVLPVWEDPSNINGGCWSFKISEDNSYELWEDLSIVLMCNTLLQSNKETSGKNSSDNKLSPDSNDIVGLSLCLKKNSNVVIKIWNKSSNNNSLKLLNNNILEKWGTDIIYIAHIAN
jgi:hypothetical protein